MTRRPDATTLCAVRDELERRLPDYLADLETLVGIESGSYTKPGVDEVATWMAQRLEALGARSSAIPTGIWATPSWRRSWARPLGPR